MHPQDRSVCILKTVGFARFRPCRPALPRQCACSSYAQCCLVSVPAGCSSYALRRRATTPYTVAAYPAVGPPHCVFAAVSRSVLPYHVSLRLRVAMLPCSVPPATPSPNTRTTRGHRTIVGAHKIRREGTYDVFDGGSIECVEPTHYGSNVVACYFNIKELFLK